MNIALPGAERKWELPHGANLEGAALSEANHQGAELREVNLTEANLAGVNLVGADLEEALLFGQVTDRNTLWLEGFDPVAVGLVFSGQR